MTETRDPETDLALTKAATLVEALPWIRRFRGEIIVVKFGGNAMVRPELTRSFAEDMVFLRSVGVLPVVVHGGGPQISAALEDAGIASEFRGGYRYTSPEAMSVVRSVLVDGVNRGLVAEIDAQGGWGTTLSGAEGGLFRGRKRTALVDGVEEDLGQVGDVVRVRAEVVRQALRDGRIPVVSSVAVDDADDTGLLNVNADAAAAALAEALGAAKLMILTDVQGLYADWPQRDSLIDSISADELRALIPSLESGMIPKMSACLQAVDGGVAKSAIIDGRMPHSVLLEIFTTSGIGTEVTPEEKP